MSTITIRFEGGNVSEQSYQQITRIVGLVNARNLISLFDIEDLNANPRLAKSGEVTDSIIDSIQSSPSTFPFKTKGILVGTTKYEALERNRYRLFFENTDYEGIMDGGHNMLAIGLHILSNINEIDQKLVKKIKTWTDFKEVWIEFRDQVLAVAAGSDEDLAAFLDFVVPVEIVVPSEPESAEVLNNFRTSLRDICDARNHNVQLRDEALANKAGLYDALREVLAKELEERVEWRQNEGGDIKAREILALGIIALNRLDLPAAEDGSQIKPLSPTAVYNSKASCVTQFNAIMSAPSVSSLSDDGTRRVVHNEAVLSALKITAQFPAIYDAIYKAFPAAYNATGARFGANTFVKAAADMRYTPTTRYTNDEVEFQYPDGFIMPLVVAMGKLIRKGADGNLSWAYDPFALIANKFDTLVERHMVLIDDMDRNPNKVGKNLNAYKTLEEQIELILLREGVSLA